MGSCQPAPISPLDVRLHQDLQHSFRHRENRDAIDLAFRNGAKCFTLNSLVRLRCAGADASKLSTKPTEREANYHFTDYATSLTEVDQQQKMAAALSGLFRRLSNQNRKDLKETRSALAADGNLRPAETLVRVDKTLWEVCPEPLASRLHPSLLDHKGIAGLCRPFALETWVVEAADRAAEGTIEDAEREALYRHLLLNGATLGRKAMATVRRSPVVLDHRGNWVSPVDLAQLPRAQAAFLSAVMSAPAPALAKRAEFLRRLRIRRKLTADDLIRFAPTIDGDAAVASRFEKLLNKHQHLLKPKVVAALHSIAFLHSRTGTLIEPEQAYLPTAANVACLEADDAIVARANSALYRRLGCRERPVFRDTPSRSPAIEGERYSARSPRGLLSQLRQGPRGRGARSGGLR